MAISREQVERSRVEWRALREGLVAIPPRAFARGLLAAGVAGAGLWLAVATWPALLPFGIGAVLAYMMLPVVNVLDRVMPRLAASVVTILLVLAVVVGFFIVVLPPFARAVGQLAGELPTRAEISAWADGLEASLGDAAGPIGPQLAGAVGQVVTAIGERLEQSTGGIGGIATTVIQAAIGAVGAAIGLVVLPAWILTTVRDQPVGRQSARGSLPAWMRDDAWAVVRMGDRVAANYLRGRVWLGVLVGSGVWLSLEAAERLGAASVRDGAPVAVFAGAMQLIPEIGPIIGYLPALLALPISGELAAVYLASYLGSRLVAGWVTGRQGPRRQLHPVLMVPGIVALTQFGLLWLFLAGPLLTMGYDLVRYARGRLSDPPAPAGVIPDEGPATTRVETPAQRVIPTAGPTVTARG
jgi:predicted PurR-regulated permease PerM